MHGKREIGMGSWSRVQPAMSITVFTVGLMDCIQSQLNIYILCTRYVALDTLLPLAPAQVQPFPSAPSVHVLPLGSQIHSRFQSL
jgi:hypothetical protein